MKQFLFIILIVIIGFVIYANTLQNKFVYDDSIIVVDNVYIKDWKYLLKIFTTDLLRGGKNQSNFYRPIQTLTYLIDHTLFKLNPFGYHLTNILFHLANAVLIFFLTSYLTKNLNISAITSLLFVTHPIHTEAVTYVSGRADLVALFFMLISLLLFIKYTEKPNKIYYLISIFSFILALLSKEIVVIFPLFLISYRHYFLKDNTRSNLAKRLKLYYPPYFIGVIIYAFLRITYLKFPMDESTALASVDIYSRLLTASKALLTYFKLFFLPFGLHMERTIKVSHSIFEPKVLTSLILISFLLIFMVRSFKKLKVVSFGLCWFFINLLPVSNIIPLNAFLAEHWLYIPSIGFFMIVSFGIERLVHLEKPILKKSTIFSLVVIFLFYSVLTIVRNRDWKDELTFYTNTLKYAPNSDRIHFNLGFFYLTKQQLIQKALEEFREAVRINPRHIKTRYHLAKIYERKGEFERAKEEYNTILKLKPNNINVMVDIYTELGSIYSVMQEFDDAIKSYKIVLGLEPTHPLANFGLANIYLERNDYTGAIYHYQQAIKGDPNFAEPYNNLGLIYLEKGLLDEAITKLRHATKLQPNRTEFHMNLGTVYSRKNLFKEANVEWKRALELDPSLDVLKENIKKIEEMGF